MDDWRDALLQRFSFPRYERTGRNPVGWPGYRPVEVVRYGIGEIGGVKVVACVWDFTSYGGSFGEVDATAFAEACDLAIQYDEPLVSFVRTGGTRLQEGVAALVGIARTQLALGRLAAARVPHVAVADHPTTGGVFIGVVSRADIRLAVAGATVGFAGPRVAEAVTGLPLPPGSHTAEGARGAGSIDEVLPPDAVGDRIAAVLRVLRATPSGDADGHPDAPVSEPPARRTGIEQVERARDARLPHGADLLGTVLADGVGVRAPGGDDTVAARLGTLAGAGPVVGVAVAARKHGRPTPAGYRVLHRAIALADRLDLPLVTLVDTPGAEPGADAERAGIASAIADTFDAMLSCRAGTISVITGEGGSGGALAAAAADVVLVTDDGYLAALGAEGTAVALGVDVAVAADRLRLTPADLLALGLADAAAPSAVDAAALGATVAAHALSLRGADPAQRLLSRARRWAAPLPGSLR